MCRWSTALKVMLVFLSPPGRGPRLRDGLAIVSHPMHGPDRPWGKSVPHPNLSPRGGEATRSALAVAAWLAAFAAQQRELQLFEIRQVALELLDLLAERLHVLEFPIDRSEAHVGHLVELLQLAHHQLADLARRHFALAAAAQVVDDLAHRVVDVVAGDGPLLQRALEARAQLALVEGLAPFAALDDCRQLQLRRLEGIEALAALRALATAAHGGAVLGQPRIDHARVFVLAERAVHPASVSRTPGTSCTALRPAHAPWRSPPRRPARRARRTASWPGPRSRLPCSRGW